MGVVERSCLNDAVSVLCLGELEENLCTETLERHLTGSAISRALVAERVRRRPEVLEELSQDPNEHVRMVVPYNPECSIKVLYELSKDIPSVSNLAKLRLLKYLDGDLLEQVAPDAGWALGLFPKLYHVPFLMEDLAHHPDSRVVHELIQSRFATQEILELLAVKGDDFSREIANVRLFKGGKPQPPLYAPEILDEVLDDEVVPLSWKYYSASGPEVNDSTRLKALSIIPDHEVFRSSDAWLNVRKIVRSLENPQRLLELDWVRLISIDNPESRTQVAGFITPTLRGNPKVWEIVDYSWGFAGTGNEFLALLKDL